MKAQRQYRVMPRAGVELLTASYRNHRFIPHSHNYAVLAITESGEAMGQSPESFNHFGPGLVLLIPPGVVHAARSLGADPWRYRALYLSRERFDRIAPPALVAGATPQAVVHRDPLLAARLRELHHDLESDESGSRLVSALDSITDHLMVLAERAHVHGENGRELSELVGQAKALIDAEPSRRWSLAALARECTVSRFHLCRAFSRQVGASPYAFALQRRVDSARARLCSGLPIGTIAHDLGFADQSHFTRTFLQVFGLTPGEYRLAVRRAQSRAGTESPDHLSGRS